MKKEKILLDELTWLEVDERINKADIAYIPIGVQESHGRILPMGTDIYIAAGISILASQKTGGIVLNPLSYGFSGATNVFRGTISIPMNLHMQLLKEILKNLWEQKFSKLIIVNIHSGNVAPATIAIRELFEYENIVASLHNPMDHIDKNKYETDCAGLETGLCFAAMEILGKKHLLPNLSKLKNKSKPALDLPGFKGLKAGYHFTDLDQHQPERKVTMVMARKMLGEAADNLIDNVSNLNKYVKYLKEKK